MPGSISPRPWQGAELFAPPWNCDPVSFQCVVLARCWFLVLFLGFICYTKANGDKERRTAIRTDILTLQRVQETPHGSETEEGSSGGDQGSQTAGISNRLGGTTWCSLELFWVGLAQTFIFTLLGVFLHASSVLLALYTRSCMWVLLQSILLNLLQGW